MGCDIHMRAEFRKDKNSEWQILGDVFTNPWYNKNSPKTEWNRVFTSEPYGERNYDLFAILADVRNGYGFARTKTGEGFNIISEPKGIPSDCSKEGKEFLESYDCDGHSHSYFNVKELLDFDWYQITLKRGYLSYDHFLEIIKTGENPKAWCGDTNCIKIEEEEAIEVSKLDNWPIDYINKHVYVNYRWSVTYHSRCEIFVDKTIPNLLKFGEAENVRIIFFFDN